MCAGSQAALAALTAARRHRRNRARSPSCRPRLPTPTCCSGRTSGRCAVALALAWAMPTRAAAAPGPCVRRVAAAGRFHLQRRRRTDRRRSYDVRLPLLLSDHTNYNQQRLERRCELRSTPPFQRCCVTGARAFCLRCVRASLYMCELHQSACVVAMAPTAQVASVRCGRAGCCEAACCVC